MNRTFAENAIVFAPRGRDAAIAAAMLRDSDMEVHVAGDMAGFVAALREGAGFALVTEEALRGADLRGVAAFIEAQAEWSDFPFILLTERGGGLERNPAAGRFLETLGNVTFLERPFHPTTLLSLCKAALRARRRQYEARARLEAIHEGEEQLRIALAAGRLGAWTLDVPSRTLEASDHCKGNFGRGPEDPFGYDDLLASVHPADRDAMEDAVRVSLEAGTDYDVEYRAIWPDGSLHWIEVRGRPEFDRFGQPMRMAGVSHEVSERRQAEDALRDFAAEMERRVEERTREREIAVAQLHEAQKLETLGQLTGGVAHDFNNLLTPVIGGLDLLRHLHGDDRSQRLIGGALQASERARTLVSRLLAFARRQNLEARAVDMALLVEGMLDLIQRSLGPQIEISRSAPAGLPAARVDPNQLELALLNLAVNARDAMPEGGRLSIDLTAETAPPDNPAGVAPGDYLRLTIRDSGAGMDADTLRRAIEPFYSTKGVGKGTGLGLSMVHGLAAQSGGALLLHSAPGAGTTAELWLPEADTPAEIAQPMAEQSLPETPPLTILLVDDEELVRCGTADMLADLGHCVTQATSGTAALSLLRTQGYDLLVTDYLMPAMNGLELVGEVRRLRPDLPALLITGFADLAEGATEHLVRLPKPFRQADLAQAVAHVVAGETAL